MFLYDHGPINQGLAKATELLLKARAKSEITFEILSVERIHQKVSCYC